MNSDLQLRDVIRVLLKRKLIILAAFVLGVAAAVTSVFFKQKEYSATATIEVNREKSNALGLNVLSENSENGNADQMNSELLTQQAVIMSDNTALRVIKKLNLDSSPPYALPPTEPDKADAFAKERGIPIDSAPLQQNRVLKMFHSRLKVKLVKGTRLIEVLYTDPDPARSAAVANAMIDAFTDEYAEQRYRATSKTSSWLANQLSDLKDKVTQSQAKVEEYQRESGLAGVGVSMVAGKPDQPTAVASPRNVSVERLVQLNEDLTKAEVARIAKEAIFRMTQTQDPDVVLGIGSSELATGPGADSVVSPGSPDLAVLQQMRQHKADLDVKIAALSTKYGAKNPIMNQLQTELEAQKEQIRTELARIRLKAKNDLDVARMSESSIQQRIQNQEQEVNTVNEKTDRLLLLQQEALSSRTLYQDLYAKLQEASLVAGMNASNITLVDSARFPVSPSSPNKWMSIGLGGALGLLLGIVLACLWDYFDDSVTTPEHVAEITGLPVIGLIPTFPAQRSLESKQQGVPLLKRTSQADANAWLLRAPRSHVSESFRMLRTTLQMSSTDRPPKVITVVSAGPREGKSSVCFNTAAAFAVQGLRVLYVDADMRRATRPLNYKCNSEVGLSNYLNGGTPLLQTVHPSDEIKGFAIMPPGDAPSNPAELIGGSGRFAAMVKELRSHFEYIFIDSPPLLLVTDGHLLSSVSDGYVLVVRAGITTRQMLRASLSMIAGHKPQALGVVLNAVDTKSPEYRGYYYQKGRSYYVETAR